MLLWLINNTIGRLVARPVRRQIAALESATHRPREVQEELLKRILAYHADTDFGRKHRFRDIRASADFQRHLPVAGYDYFEPYITQVRQGRFDALLADKTIHMFALTSGTTADRKFIPVTPQYLDDYKRGWNIWGLSSYDDHPKTKLRPIVQMSGDWDEFRTEAGIPCGTVTGLTAKMQKKVVRWVYCVPACCGKIKNATAKYYTALRLSLPRKVGMIIAANPSTLINMARLGDHEKESLLRDLRDGTLDPRFEVPAEVHAALHHRLSKKHPQRVRELEEIIRRTGRLFPRDYWPETCLLGNWTGGSMGAYLRQYPRYYGQAPVRDIGLIASEGRMTIPLADGTSSGLLDITSHYFEFLPEEELESPQPTVVAAHEVQEGQSYYILPTTKYGLYRYQIYDLVRVTGFHNETPLVEFLNKGSYVANITGEKLSEHHVTYGMAQVLHELDLCLGAYSVAPCWDDELPYYGLFIERGELPSAEHGLQLAESLDQRLMKLNVEYASKRDTLRLGPIRLELLKPGTWQDWDRKRLARTGGTLEQYKHPCLISDPAFRDSLPVEEELCADVAAGQTHWSGHPAHGQPAGSGPTEPRYREAPKGSR
jgi:GH3 auxin-responsive promoter